MKTKFLTMLTRILTFLLVKLIHKLASSISTSKSESLANEKFTLDYTITCITERWFRDYHNQSHHN